LTKFGVRGCGTAGNHFGRSVYAHNLATLARGEKPSERTGAAPCVEPVLAYKVVAGEQFSNDSFPDGKYFAFVIRLPPCGNLGVILNCVIHGFAPSGS
jgi:hypothetical protein